MSEAFALAALVGASAEGIPRSAAGLLARIAIPPALRDGGGPLVARAVLAEALNIVLLADLVDRTPTAASYMAALAADGGTLVLDHGALRTVDLPAMGALPSGRLAIARILEPLGYEQSGVYPLDALRMTGYSYTHADFPEDVPQFFVSELHVDRFSQAFAAAMTRVTADSTDPLDAWAIEQLQLLAADRALPLPAAAALLPRLVLCFGRRHGDPLLSDYQTLLGESAEAAWIATEGNVFNHATHRVDDIEALVAAQVARGVNIKQAVEVSASGRVRQTAFRADMVDRSLIGADGERQPHRVPGSFFEFIERSTLDGGPAGEGRLDLTFDSSNAQGIFAMTAARQGRPSPRAPDLA